MQPDESGSTARREILAEMKVGSIVGDAFYNRYKACFIKKKVMHLVVFAIKNNLKLPWTYILECETAMALSVARFWDLEYS